MKGKKPKWIKVIGVVLIIVSVLLILFNTLSAKIWSAMEMSDYFDPLYKQNPDYKYGEGFDPLYFIFTHFTEISLLMISLGILYLIGAIFILKYKMWAHTLTTIVSILIMLLIWGLFLITFIEKNAGTQFFSLTILLKALMWSAPIGLVVWYLNKKSVKQNFV